MWARFVVQIVLEKDTSNRIFYMFKWIKAKLYLMATNLWKMLFEPPNLDE